MAVDAELLCVETLARAAADVASAGDLRAALGVLAQAAVDAAGADLAVVRLLDDSGELTARVVAPEHSALGAEVVGSRSSGRSLAGGRASEATGTAATRARAAGLHAVPVFAGTRLVGSLELVRLAEPFDASAEAVAELVGAHIALVLRALGPDAARASGGPRWLEVAGEALSAGGEVHRSAQQAVRVAVEATGARGGALWLVGRGGEVELGAAVGGDGGDLDVVEALARSVLVPAARGPRPPAGVIPHAGLPGGATHVATLAIGQPIQAALQLYFTGDVLPHEAELEALAAFAARVGQALRSGERARQVEEELDRTRALLEVVGAAIARLSLAHTLETAVERIADLLGVDQVGVYLREGGRLLPAAGRGLVSGHDEIAAELLEVALGPLRARDSVHVDTAGESAVLAGARAALRHGGQRSALAVPLHVRDESIGLLVAYPGSRTLGHSDVSLLTSLAGQLAVAVQNARLHERSKELGEALGAVLESERQTSRQVNALYEISRSFAQSLSLETTLAAVTATIVEVLGVDAAVIRVPDDRGDQFVPRAVHVARPRLSAAVHAILERPQPRPARRGAALLDVVAAESLGGAHALLIPFLEKGSTAALLPITTPTELLAELTIVSLDPAVPIDAETLATAQTIARQASLAIDNARLYQQQKRFAETMQQSLLPRDRPAIAGLEVGTVYESAAQVDVGGDVFDFLELADGRLAVVLGDVTGHGIDATADMAMAKFVFRSLAREHPEPSEFLAYANEVVVGEIAVGKFITMVYVAIDPAGTVQCASAGHPQPRLVLADGTVSALACGGLALGIDAPQTYVQMSAELPVGTAVVLYTDGVIEARADRDLFGVDRLDSVLARHSGRPAQAMADAVAAACRVFAGGQLGDDCAIVVIKRT